MKQDEAVARESLEILNGIPHAAALLGADGRILAMNGHLETLTGHRSEEVDGIPGELVIRSREGLSRSVLDGALRTGAPASLESDLLGADRRRVPVRITLSPLRQDARSPSALLLFIEDISLVRKLDALSLAAAPVQGIVTKSASMQRVLELLPVMARTDATLLVTGETGTGKDLLAEAVHASSRRAKFPFIKVNCGALPESLLESELFGHARGAFTGAHADKPGLFRLAQGGTIFLTEIGDLPLQLQVKLLTALDDRAFYPLGSSKKVEVDVRVVAGTHRDLAALVAEGRFRQDLFFRLNVLNVRLPPLREREGDVRLLTDHFLEQLSKRLGKAIDGLSPQAQTVLDLYGYPGNVRELRNIVEYAASVCREKRIRPEHLPEYLVRGAAPVSGPERPRDERGEGSARRPARRALRQDHLEGRGEKAHHGGPRRVRRKPRRRGDEARLGAEHAVAKDEAASDRVTAPARVNLLVPLSGEVVAPRFDLATEVLIVRVRKGRLAGEPRIVLLPGPSADALCSLVLEEGITDVACGGIEDAHYQYLGWKKVRVVDRVIGSWEAVLRLFLRGELRPGTVVRELLPTPGSAAGAAARR